MTLEESRGIKSIALWYGGLGALLGAFAAGATFFAVFQSYIGLPEKLKLLEDQVKPIIDAGVVTSATLKSEAEAIGLVRFDTPLSIRDTRESSVVVVRHGPGGDFVSSYRDDHTPDAPEWSYKWSLHKEPN